MTSISAIDTNTAINQKSATYNAVKIQINDPRTNIPEGYKSSPEDNGIYNAVNIEVNRPTIETGRKCIYDYPQAKCPIDCKHVPHLHNIPVAYQTNFINNRTMINAEIEYDDNRKCKDNKTEEKSIPVTTEDGTEPVKAEGIIMIEEIIAVPEPNVTTIQEQKNNNTEVSFNGISFKAENPKPQTIEIVPPVEIKPDVDVNLVVKNLANSDFDTQAIQMEEIARAAMLDKQKAVPYVVTEIFSELINIVNKDTSNLTPPSDKQIELRKQIIINEIVKEQAAANNQTTEKIELPYKLDESDYKEASKLSSMEQAERNKEYALYTMSILAKVYTDEVEKHTGNVVPLTDLPGVSEIVNALRQSPNTGVKVAALDALRYIHRPEYKDELVSIFDLATKDSNPYVARNAAEILDSIN